MFLFINTQIPKWWNGASKIVVSKLSPQQQHEHL